MEQRCKNKRELPCLKFDASKPDEMTAFVKKYGCENILFDADGTARIETIVRNEPRWIYCKNSSWLVNLGFAQFTAVTGRLYDQIYELI